jgi:hypothetical protein
MEAYKGQSDQSHDEQILVCTLFGMNKLYATHVVAIPPLLLSLFSFPSSGQIWH